MISVSSPSASAVRRDGCCGGTQDLDRPDLRGTGRVDHRRNRPRRPRHRLADRGRGADRCRDPPRPGPARRRPAPADGVSHRRRCGGAAGEEPGRPGGITNRGAVPRAGTSPAAIALHYDISDDFFRGWLGDDLVYSCALWQPADPLDTLPAAQRRKIDWFAERLGVADADVLDVGCGWGALLDRMRRRSGSRSGVGLTLSANQERRARDREVPDTTFLLQSWTEHRPTRPYDVITAIESTEHFASDGCTPDTKVDVYREFFDAAASWLRPGGRMGLQLICLDGLGEETSRLGRTPVGDLIGREVFPESLPASLAEMVLGWETHFRLSTFLDSTADYVRTFRAWALAHRGTRADAERLVGPEVARRFDRYFAAGEVCFRLREHALYRVILTKRPEPKSWAVLVRPSDVPTAVPLAAAPGIAAGASPTAVRAHYDRSDDFYATWLGPTM